MSLVAHRKEYPMWVVRVSDVLEMRGSLRGHQQLLYDGLLVRWKPGMSSVFVSHQWLGVEHPDPSGQHLRTLQEALRNIISGEVPVCSDIAYQFMGVFRRMSREERQQLASAYVWLDWWSIPQTSLRSFCWIEDSALERDQKAGIRSIPFYVGVSQFFIALAPPLEHEVTGRACGLGTYLKRGWCRAELWCRFLACHETKEAKAKRAPVIVVAAEDNIEYCSGEVWRHCIAHEGDFLNESDREHVAKICRAALDFKIHEALSSGDLDVYRVLTARYEDLTGAEDKERSLEQFLSDFQFPSLKAALKVKKGLGALSCAALSSDLPMMRTLVEMRASFKTKTKQMFDVGIGPEFTPLHMAVVRTRRCERALALILELRADPNQPAGASSSALGWCHSARAVEIMVRARADVNRISPPPLSQTPLVTAAMCHQKPEVFEKLMELRADVNKYDGCATLPLNNLAVFSHMGYPENLEVAELLLSRRAEVNARTRPRGAMVALSLAARLRKRLGNAPLLATVFANLNVSSLGFAAAVGELRMVRLLLHARGDPLQRSAAGTTQLEMARSRAVREAMEQHGTRRAEERNEDSASEWSGDSPGRRTLGLSDPEGLEEEEEELRLKMPFDGMMCVSL